MPSLSGFAESLVANLVVSTMTVSFWAVAIVMAVDVVYLLRKRRKSQRLRSVVEELLKDANDATHEILNAPISITLDAVQRKFDKWDSDMRDKLEGFRREKICSAWQVDHFKVPTTFPALIPATENKHGSQDRWLKSMVADKIHRLKYIAKELDDSARTLWAF